MKYWTLISLAFLCIKMKAIAQQNNTEIQPPYYEIPAEPETYTAATMAARMLDGLGFRYYWASEGLRAEDLAYKPSEDSRTTGETIDHIYGLVLIIYNTIGQKANTNEQAQAATAMSFEQKREETLEKIKKASDFLKMYPTLNLVNNPIIFKNGDKTAEFPFWNLVNGPIADALYHTGQVVVFRRNSGNPINPALNQFTGKVRK